MSRIRTLAIAAVLMLAAPLTMAAEPPPSVATTPIEPIVQPAAALTPTLDVRGTIHAAHLVDCVPCQPRLAGGELPLDILDAEHQVEADISPPMILAAALKMRRNGPARVDPPAADREREQSSTSPWMHLQRLPRSS